MVQKMKGNVDCKFNFSQFWKVSIKKLSKFVWWLIELTNETGCGKLAFSAYYEY